MKSIKVILLSFIVLLLFVKCSGDAKVQQQLDKYAKEENATYPTPIDDVTTLVSCEALPGKTLRYNYDVSMDKSQIDTLLVKASLKVKLLSLLKVDPGTAYFRDNNTTFQYNYKDKDGNYIFQLVLTPQNYQTK